MIQLLDTAQDEDKETPSPLINVKNNLYLRTASPNMMCSRCNTVIWNASSITTLKPKHISHCFNCGQAIKW